MDKGFLHLHTTVIVLFLLFFGYKTFLLLSNRKEALDRFRARTKIADMILGSLILITGIYLLVKSANVQPYHYLKIGAAIASIPMGIIAFKKGNKALAMFVVVLFLYVFGVAWTKSFTFASSEPVASDKSVKEGQTIYAQSCASCHGADGKLGSSGAKDLTQSSLTHGEKIAIITKGKGLMNSFGNALSPEQIDAVATYVDGMKK